LSKASAANMNRSAPVTAAAFATGDQSRLTAPSTSPANTSHSSGTARVKMSWLAE
jgi:hypothetical protein